MDEITDSPITLEEIKTRHDELLHATKSQQAPGEYDLPIENLIRDMRSLGHSIKSQDARDELWRMFHHWRGYLQDEVDFAPPRQPSEEAKSLAAFWKKQNTSLLSFSFPQKINAYLILLGILIFLVLLSFVFFRQVISNVPASFPTQKDDYSLANLMEASTATARAAAPITATAALTTTRQAKVQLSATPDQSARATALPSVFLAPSLNLLSPQNGQEIALETTLGGVYQNLHPGWSIHALIQPLSQGGKYYSNPSFYTVPDKTFSGEFEIHLNLAHISAASQPPGTLIITIVVANHEQLRTTLNNAQFQSTDLPPDSILLDSPVLVKLSNAP